MPERRFWHKVARKIGCTVAEAQERMDSAEFVEWIAEYCLDPWDEDWRTAANLSAILINVNRGKNQKAVKPDDFIPRAIKPKRKMSAEEITAVFRMSAGG